MSTRSKAGWLFLVLVAASSGCGRNEEPVTIVGGGDPERGKTALAGFGCTACHTIPGIRGANGLVGPPLTHFARRAYIAGQLPNDVENLVRWIQNPQAVEPGTAMPDLGVVPAVARDMAAYLYTLR
jgi:cytochrome c